MSDFAETWNLCRQRFLDEIAELSDEQLRWKLHDNALSIGQMALHVAGVEIYYCNQMLGTTPTADVAKLVAATADGVSNDRAFPFADAEINAILVSESLRVSKSFIEPQITSPSEEALKREFKSALGPIITGRGALARLSFHPGYHLGQAYLIKSCPGFPA
jgi:hypothetical protein